MLKSIRPVVFILIEAIFLLSACSYPSSPTVTNVPQSLIQTAAAQTVIAEITQIASGATQPAPTQPGETPQAPVNTATQGQPVQQPTNTPIPPTAVPPTNTSVPPTATQIPPTAIPVPCNQMEYIKDVNYPDGTQVDPGTTFDKTWRLKNTGSCTWNSYYVLIFDHGDALDASASVLLTSGKVHPGDTVDVTVPDMVAPDAAGTYQGFWKVRDGSGHVFGYGPSNKAFWVKIVVSNPVAYDFIDKAKKATWSNATETLPFGDQNDDTPGIVAFVYDIKMENGTTYDTALATYPQKIDDGIISGLYTDYKVANGDHFRSKAGFRYNCQVGQVKFRLSYKEGTTVKLLKEWSKKCNGSLLSMDYDLSSLKGKTVKFILTVTADGSSAHDNVLWIDPRIQK